MPRPRRLRLPDFAGRMAALPDGPESWQRLDQGTNHGQSADCCLVLGLGPQGAGPGPALASSMVYWLEDDLFLSQANIAPPARWRRINLSEALDLAPHCRIYFYKPALRHNPAFWHHVRSQMEWKLQKDHFRSSAASVWLPGDNSMLLHQELQAALAELGYNALTALPCGDNPLQGAWNGILPCYVLSVNMRGLDAAGRIFGLCQAADVPVAIWFVDNVWNQLSAVPLPWWQEAHIFVSDESFIPALNHYGARKVHYLPLAAAGHFFAAGGAGQGRPLFVGRSRFPGRDSYFAHCCIPAQLLDEALSILDNGGGPDFFWWEDRLQSILWPGPGSRLPAFGAELCSERRRAMWLAAALPEGLEIVGDEHWRELLPGAAISPLVDYYGALAHLYANALCCLNVTSLQLPGSLNQRHFDVWAAGGFLLTDYTDGLALFPEELISRSILNRRQDFSARAAWLRSHERERREICGQWRGLLLEQHLYRHRLAALESVLFQECDQTR